MLNQKKLIVLALCAVGLSACGNNDYNGTYSGLVTTTANSSFGSTGSSAYQVNLSMQENGNIVTGSLTAPGAAGTLTADSSQSGTLSNIQLNMSSSSTVGTGYSSQFGSTTGVYNCYGAYTGSLKSIDSGDALNGTLTPLSSGYSSYSSTICGSQYLSLTKNK